MTHAAKKVRTGEYEYRGYNIEEVGKYSDTPNIAAWNIRNLSEDAAHDTSNTLADAKRWIDGWIARKDGLN